MGIVWILNGKFGKKKQLVKNYGFCRSSVGRMETSKHTIKSYWNKDQNTLHKGPFVMV